MNVTPIYQLGYFVPNLSTASNLDLDKNRFNTIENQLYNVYNIFGNGIAPVYDNMGAQLDSWIISVVPNEQAVQISSGKGHINYTYAETNAPVKITLSLPVNTVSGVYRFYFYAIATDTTPVDKSANFISSLTQIVDPVNYIGLGAADLTIDIAAGTFALTVYNDPAYGRQVISVLASLSSLVKNHLHVGGSNEPSPIDLGAHVTGFLSSNNIDFIDANKISSGTLDPNRLPLIDHNSLMNIGTLTHQQIDALLASLQSTDANYQLSNYGIVNRLQLILALKKQSGFFNIDGEQWNVILYMPYTQLSGFVDTSFINDRPVTTATIDTNVHRVYGATGVARQSYVIKINSTQDFLAALFLAQDSIPNPAVTTNVTVTGVNSTSAAGSVNNPYGVTGSATSIYISSFQDSFISQFNHQGSFLQRKIDFDPNLNLNTPLGVHYDPTLDNLYIADTLNNRIIVTDGNLVNNKAQIGYNGGKGQQGNDQGGFAFPKGVYGIGNTFYVADSGNNQIQKFSWPSGQAPFWIATYKYSEALSNIQNIYQSLSDPRGIISTIIDNSNYLFISDYGNHRVIVGIETHVNGVPSLNVTQILGANSAGFNINNPSLLAYSSNSTGIGAQFSFSTSVNGTISSISVINSGSGYENSDQFNLTYNGQSAGYFLVNTNNSGQITQAYASNGISTDNLRGFAHPQGMAFTNTGSVLDLLIVDTDNNRVVNYATPVGIGSTSNRFSAKYFFGVAGIGTDTPTSIYFSRPANIFAKTGFTTVFVSDSLNNRIHSLSTSFVNGNGLGITAFTFGVADTSLTSGGITLSKPNSYLSVASSWNLDSEPYKPATWVWGINQSVVTGIEGGKTDKYNFIYNSYPAFQYEDKLAVAISTMEENFESGVTLGDIYCYLIYDPESSNGNLINFNLIPTGSSLNSIKISAMQPLRQLISNGTYSSGATTVSKIFNLSAFTGQIGGVQPQIFGFGFLWSTDYGWLNNDNFGLEFMLPSFPNNVLFSSYPEILAYQQKNALTRDSVFAFNAGQYASSGYFVFRYDSGPGGNATFDYAIFEYSTPASANGQAKITFNYRTADNIGALNSNGNWQNYGYNSAIGIVSGEALSIGKQARYIDLIFYMESSVDRFEPPTISSISLFFNVNGIANGIIYDTNVGNAPVLAYPRFKWSQGSQNNIKILPVEGDSSQAYDIQISDTSKVNDYLYLSTNTLKFGDSSFSSFLDINNNYYLSPYQNFIGSNNGLLNAQHFVTNGANGYFIADTDNDRVLEVGQNGQLVSAIQGNIKLCRLDRDFVILGVYYNSRVNQIYALFSQYIAFSLNYIQYLSVKVDGANYSLSDPTYFRYLSDGSILAGLYKINTNSQSATFYVTVTPAMDLIIKESLTCYFEIDQSVSPPFVLANPRSDGFASDSETFTYKTTAFGEFQYNSLLGVGTILDYQPNITVVSSDPTVFSDNTDSPSTVLWSYYPVPNYSSSYSILITVGNIYVDNIFKPIHVDYTNSGSLVVSTVGNNSIRAYDSLSFESIYTVGQSNFVFNEKLGGSTVVLDGGVGQPGNSLLIAQPSIDYTTASPIIGYSTSPSFIYVYDRNKNFFINKLQFSSTVVKAVPDANEYVALLYDWEGLGLRSKLIRVRPDSTTNFVVSNVLSKPVSLNLQLNGKYYVTDTTGQLGSVFFRKFIADGSGNTIGAANTGSGTGSSSGGNTSGNPTGGSNFGGNSTGGKLPASGGNSGGGGV